MNSFLLITFLYLQVFSPADSYSESVCEVTGFYEIANPEPDLKVLTTSGELTSVEVLLKPIKPDEGSYEIQLTRKAPDFYLVTDCNRTGKIVANKFYIETRYCNEFANYDNATLVVTGNFGLVKGNLTFK